MLSRASAQITLTRGPNKGDVAPLADPGTGVSRKMLFRTDVRRRAETECDERSESGTGAEYHLLITEAPTEPQSDRCENCDCPRTNQRAWRFARWHQVTSSNDDEAWARC